MTYLRYAARSAIRVIALLILLATAVGFAWPPADRSPSATIRVQAINDRVTIQYDRDGVPRIRATSENDAHFGLGFAHARDRLWQMEYQRRLAGGRLAEVLGEPGLRTDRLFRVVGLNRTAAAIWAAMKPEDQQPILAYVAGVNAYINRSDRRLSPEWALLGVEPQP